MGGAGGNPQEGPEQSNGGPSAGQETPRVPQAKNPGVKTPVPKIPIPGGANDSDLFKLRTTDMNFNHLKSNRQFAEAPDGAGGGDSNLQSNNYNGKMYQKVNETLKTKGLLHDGEIVEEPKPIKIIGINPHAFDRMGKHNITKENAQEYIDKALARIRQSKDKFEYIARDGTAITLEGGRLITAYQFSAMTIFKGQNWR